jgi:hypothetical protein
MTFDWPALVARPAVDDFPAWFDRIADRLLNGCRLVANGVPLRLIEVEAYYHGPGHEDPFAHRDPVQLTPGRWYFHRTAGEYRGGSFKGLDLAFGHRDMNAFGGFLFRGVVLPDGGVIDGPSLTVDHLLKTTAHASVSALDTTIAERLGWVEGLPIQLAALPEVEGRPLLKSIRVGLTLKRRKFKENDPAFGFLFRSYRYLAEPRKTAKGKPHMVLPLIAARKTPEEITATTGCPTATVRRYTADFAAGRTLATPEPYYGKEMGTADLCKLYGLWWERYGQR